MCSVTWRRPGGSAAGWQTARAWRAQSEAKITQLQWSRSSRYSAVDAGILCTVVAPAWTSRWPVSAAMCMHQHRIATTKREHTGTSAPLENCPSMCQPRMACRQVVPSSERLQGLLLPRRAVATVQPWRSAWSTSTFGVFLFRKRQNIPQTKRKAKKCCSTDSVGTSRAHSTLLNEAHSPSTSWSSAAIAHHPQLALNGLSLIHI